MPTTTSDQHDATTPHRNDEVARGPWSLVRGLLATTTLAGTIPLAVITTHHVVASIAVVSAHTTAFIAVVGVALTAVAARTITVAWRTGGLVDPAADTHDLLLVPVSVAALFTHHQGWALLIWVTRLGYSALTAFPAHLVQHLRHAWWTPVGAYRHGLANATLDAATHAHKLLTDPHLDGATAAQLVAVFTHDAYAIAAESVGDAPDIYRLDRGAICSVCERLTKHQPCPQAPAIPARRTRRPPGRRWDASSRSRKARDAHTSNSTTYPRPARERVT